MHDTSSLVPAANAVNREVVLDGDAAIKWFSALGWIAEPLSPRLQIVADLIRTDTFAIGRIWHTPVQLTSAFSDQAHGGMFHAVYGIEGTQMMRSKGGLAELSPGQMYVQLFGDALVITAREPVAVLFFVSQWGQLRDRDGQAPSPRAGLFGASNAYREVFTTAIHSALNSLTTVEGTGFSRFRTGIHDIFASVLADDAPMRPERALRLGMSRSRGHEVETSRPTSLLRRASQHIEAHASEVSFDVSKLSRELGVSPASLYRAYENSNLTPASQLRRIRARRARLALDELEVSGDVDTVNLKRIARASGFGSVSTMRRALERVPELVVDSSVEVVRNEAGPASSPPIPPLTSGRVSQRATPD
ncbi:hypothetical protein C5E07_05110 [Pseudoclavibacter sp. RFBJ3]|uniref:helix-turn-helix domain-containing protein n=1 Tax=unclassified Pseudoclavibacter TaxID=2615177 RepID=UPI000CE7F06D|nr:MULTISPECIES: helix-turn-helix domain-containing protein [unclassified Pseudoclavibacter]PPF84884.1 hypothetical protein C5C12_05815 [Pseudoclavibacter sp. RFBJ5]PPF93888.1 hypothetical protein C5E07_05110 [Pseudoclavibacter sp. RFBJ3]PPF98606.1 hypothetical protein C5C19_08095 [Pseudoclavibacter sp. RFBH5]PPG24434.1 hypothetical protein C5E13_06775 [Pseudoclavibacter sp. RFBI4]